MAWNPQPALGGALWQGNQTLATTRQLLSTSAGLASNGDNGFDFANISTLAVSTITGFNNGTQPINIQNVSSIFLSTAKNLVMNGSTFTLKAYSDGEILTNGSLTINNRDFLTGSRTGKLTNILTGEGSFQALAGNMTISGSDTLNLYGGNKGIFTTVYSQNGLLNGIFDISGNNLINARSISSISISTGTLRASNIRADSFSSIFLSTGAMKAGATVLDTLNAGATTVGTLNAAATSLSGALNMNANNITNVNTIGATTGNFTSITGNLTGNVSGNVTGNLTGNVTGNIYNTNLSIGGQYSISETVDVGSAISNYGNYGTLALTAKGGLGGIVNITADSATSSNPLTTVSQLNMEVKGNYGLITPGTPIGYVPRGGYVGIIARQGLTPSPPAEVTSALFANGEIDLTAYSYGTVPGLIKLSAGANFLYAGPVSPITGVIGTNNIYGTVANTITAGTPPSVVPTFPGTNYLYGSLGTSIQNTLYVDNILNYGNATTGTYSNLTISANHSKDVLISNVQTLNMQNTPTIDGAGTGTIQSFSNINGSNLNIYKQGFISSLTVDDIVWNRGSENFDSLYTSTLGVSTITGFNTGTQAINMLNYSSINISTGRNLFFGASNLVMTSSNILTLENRGPGQGLTNILASTLSLYSQNNALFSANANDLTLYGGLSTITRAGTSLYFDTPIVNNKTHLDTPSLSTNNFQATNFLATTVTIANETVSGTLTAPTIATTTINNIGSSPITVNAPSFNTTNLSSVNLNTTNLSSLNLYVQNIKGNPDISISTGKMLLQTTLNSPLPVTTNFYYTGASQSWTCPAGVTSIQITLAGAGGGSNSSGAFSVAGAGGLVSGTYPSIPGQVYAIKVGEGGGVSPTSIGRYNGGGAGAAGGANGCDGGGATTFGSDTGIVSVWAGGGGGGAAINDTGDNVGGDGGGLNGGTGGGQDTLDGIYQTGGNGGTQYNPGTAVTIGVSAPGNSGVAQTGGAAVDQTGAGGGGYYGGAGGADNPPSRIAAGGGGGGSSYVGALSGVVVNTRGGGSPATRDGYAAITYYTTNVSPNVVLDAYVDIQNKLTFNQKSIVCWTQSVSKQNTGQEWDSGYVAATDPASSRTFSSTEYVMTCALTYTSISQPYAVSWSLVNQLASGGIWYWQGKLGSATDSGVSNLTANWAVQITMIPIEMCPGGVVTSAPPIPSYSNIPLNNPNTFLSTVLASTLTMKATENASLLAGNFTVPTYFSTGSITVGGTNQASVLANIVAIGGQKDVDIAGYTGNVNIAAGSNINLIADNYLYISSGSYMNTDVYGDMTTDLGGVYTVTSAEVINLNGSNGIGLNSSNAINLTASSNVNINTFTTIQLPGTGSIPSVSPLALTSGNQYDGSQHYSQIEFQFYGGGFNHFISSRHDANVVYGTGNAIDFWLYSVNTAGDAETASSAPGTGNVNSMSITASNVVINRPIQISDTITGGTGTLTVDSGNHLYWNGTLLA